MNEIFRSDGRNMLNLVSFKSGEFLKIMLFSFSRSMHVSWSYELKRNRTATSEFIYLLIIYFCGFLAL